MAASNTSQEEQVFSMVHSENWPRRTVTLVERQHVSLNWYRAKSDGDFRAAARCDL